MQLSLFLELFLGPATKSVVARMLQLTVTVLWSLGTTGRRGILGGDGHPRTWNMLVSACSALCG
jgi:hypothetical protein